MNPFFVGVAGVALAGLLACTNSDKPIQPALGFENATLEVPATMTAAPFDKARSLMIPKTMKISVLARVDKARFMARTPDGQLLVSQPVNGKIIMVKNGAVLEFATGLRRGHDMVFREIGGQMWLYVAETHQIVRFKYANGEEKVNTASREIVVANLPDSSTPELQGSYGHELKNIAIDGNNKLYVSIASTCNVCKSDTESDPKRAAIYVYDADGKNPRLFAQGLRNAEGLDFVPGTNNLWVVVNNRDNAPYPHQKDFDGDGTNDYGKVMQSFVDNYPPEPFTAVRDGGNYGWPFCNSNPSSGINNMPFDNDMDMNRDGTAADCSKMDRVSKGIQAHSAPLGVSFVKNSSLDGAVSGLHGSWNRAVKTGYKVIYFPWQNGQPGEQIDLVSGFLEGGVWGRPVDVISDGAEGLFISDDYANAVYHLEPK